MALFLGFLKGRDLIKEINLDRTDTDDKFGFGIKAGKSSALGVLVNRVDKNSPAG